MTSSITTNSASETVAFGERVAKILPDGATLQLQSDLGGGKTTFVQGLAKGLGFKGIVASPTFTLSRVYPLPEGRELHHFDLYRLSGSDVVVTELNEIAGLPGVITAIEWPDSSPISLPKDHLVCTFTPLSEHKRRIELSGSGAWSNHVVAELGR
jgi:tRNA threonylcarbamoyladenosine biosynthesis protein TsaE